CEASAGVARDLLQEVGEVAERRGERLRALLPQAVQERLSGGLPLRAEDVRRNGHAPIVLAGGREEKRRRENVDEPAVWRSGRRAGRRRSGRRAGRRRNRPSTCRRARPGSVQGPTAGSSGCLAGPGHNGDMTTLADFTATTISGRPQPLAEHLGSVVLVVNTASRCGLTPQYAGLQALHERYSDRGLRPATSSCTRSPAPRRRSPSSARSTTASPSRCTRRSRSTGKAPIPCSGGSPAPTARGSPAGTSNGTSRSSCSGPTARCGAGTRRRRSRPIWPTTSRRSWPSGADSSAAEHPPVGDDLPAV